MSKPDYEERSELEKIQSQWHKLTGLHNRLESSAAVVRAATAAELAANFSIRQEFSEQSNLSPEFVSELLMWANGLAGKMDRILVPVTKGTRRSKVIKSLQAVGQQINRKRNEIAHQGHFIGSGEAEEAIERAREFVETLVGLYEPGFTLKDQKPNNKQKKAKV